MPRFATDDGRGTNDPAAAKQGPDGQPLNNPGRNVWVTQTALATALNTSYMAEQISLFGIGVGTAFLPIGLAGAALIVARLGALSAAADATATTASPGPRAASGPVPARTRTARSDVTAACSARRCASRRSQRLTCYLSATSREFARSPGSLYPIAPAKCSFRQGQMAGECRSDGEPGTSFEPKPDLGRLVQLLMEPQGRRTRHQVAQILRGQEGQPV